MQKLYRLFPFAFLCGHLLIGLLYCLYIACLTDTLGGDTLEHIHSSWLVYANFVPYRDFFQHHNPLLWYVFSPFVGLHAKGFDDEWITAGVTAAAILASFANFGYLYLITSRFLSDKLGGLISASIALTPYMLLSIINFRPDNFMLLAFFAGLYYYFSYLENKRRFQLCVALILFWASFMFLQKIVFTLILMGCISLYLLWKRQILWQDMLISLFIPVLLSVWFVAYLYQQDILSIWYHSNFTFNLYIPELFAQRQIGQFWPELQLLLIGAGGAIVFCLKKSTIYFKILVLIFISELCQRYFYFSAFAYYFCLLVYIASILSATFLEEKIFKRHFYLIYILLIALGVCMYKPAVYQGNIGNRKHRFYRPLNKEIVRAITPCDYVLNGDGALYNLYNRDPYYYWNLLGQLDVIGDKAGMYPLMNINRVILEYKPAIISGNPYYDKYYIERGQKVVVHEPDKEIIEKYYKPFKYTKDLYILKPEFRKLKCDYDYKARRYKSYD